MNLRNAPKDHVLSPCEKPIKHWSTVKTSGQSDPTVLRMFIKWTLEFLKSIPPWTFRFIFQVLTRPLLSTFGSFLFFSWRFIRHSHGNQKGSSLSFKGTCPSQNWLLFEEAMFVLLLTRTHHTCKPRRLTWLYTVQIDKCHADWGSCHAPIITYPEGTKYPEISNSDKNPGRAELSFFFLCITIKAIRPLSCPSLSIWSVITSSCATLLKRWWRLLLLSFHRNYCCCC